MATQKELSIKLLVDNKAKRVLFAEAGKEFVDFLFSLLSLPLSSIVQLVTKENMVGSLGSLYTSAENLSNTYFESYHNKNSMLKPKLSISATIANVPLLPPSVPKVIKYYTCSYDGDKYSSSYKCSDKYVTHLLGSTCSSCNRQMNTELPCIDDATSTGASTNNGTYVKGVVTYMVMDDLAVMPMSTISGITLLNKFNVQNVCSLEEKIVGVSIKVGLELLKTSLKSKTVLSDIFLGSKQKTTE
ncbi:hypothetical protein IFM89_020795 [Coptis chinensis]|uniref:DUF674 domain-containing protein n=1 Tax=Coptis chinensis TaxID=261450 RepID=A0A835HWD2_9MAGN|nr:hypothetical protein IFM89_020795 [Coptis chinensis]